MLLSIARKRTSVHIIYAMGLYIDIWWIYDRYQHYVSFL